MRIGVDFDNTIVCYDALFHRVALEQGLIPADLPVNKSEVRNHLRRTDREPLWTEMQGYVYGARMSEAEAFPGVIEFFQECRRRGIQLSIISHKTRHPFLGEKHDLHEAARRWLEEQGFFDPAKIGLAREEVFFELTKEAKLARIGERGCDAFIDDLPELLAEPSFPEIERILFDPGNLYATETLFTRLRSWAEISGYFRIKRFARAQGFEADLKIEALTGGGNNRVYRVSDGEREAVVKHYFQHGADRRDRFAAERAFYDFAWGSGVRRTPEPLAWDVENRLGTFSFVEGRKLKPGEVDANAVNQAMEFIVELNRHAKGAEAIPAASEACFTWADHVRLISERVERLRQIGGESAADREALSLVKEAVQPAWEKIRTALAAKPEPHLKRRVLSPSDFGFHNALLATDGMFRFFDFEYAGWDDPAKLICDFFCQPQVPVPMEFWGRVTETLAAAFDGGKALEEHARLLLPAYQIKWICIMLNEFVRTDRERRDFAQGTDSIEERKTAQLRKARAAFEKLNTR